MSSACIICHKRKVRCDLATHDPCTNCKKSNVECKPYSRKRKRFTNSLSPDRSGPSTAPLSWASRDNKQLYVEPPRASKVGSASRRENEVFSESTPLQGGEGMPIAKEESYRGRSEYLGGSVPFDENMVKPGREATYSGPKPSAADVQMLREQGAFQLPSTSIQKELIGSFTKYCAPWNPIIDPKWLDEGSQPSILLLQSIFLAGSRVSKSHLSYASSETFYRKAKLLFFFGGCENPLISIVAACLLHWYNPVGPENVSTDTSGFWIRTAGSMAFQIGLHKEPPSNSKDRGLRRRLWWSLVIRDNIISAGVGRPRTINLRDSDVLPPSLDDFPNKDFKAQLFLAYCTISCLLGDTVEYYLRKEVSRQRQVNLENALYRWVKQAMPKMQFSVTDQADLSIRHLEIQQVLVMYFVVLIILHRSPIPNSPPPAISLVASSFMAGIYEGFLRRDELRYLGPAYAFYPLCAGLSLLSGCRYPHLRSTAECELTVLKQSLEKLSERWLSAVGPLRALNKLAEKVREQEPFEGPPLVLNADMALFFEGLDTNLCKQWDTMGLIPGLADDGVRMAATCALPEVEEPNVATERFEHQLEVPVENYNLASLGTDLDLNWEGAGFDWGGLWLLNA